MKKVSLRLLSILLTIAMLLSMLPAQVVLAADVQSGTISNKSLLATVGGLGQISSLNIVNNPKNNNGADINFLLPNNTSPQNNTAHQWVGEMIFATRTSDTADFSNAGDFVEVDTNRTLAAGGSTTASNIAANNPYISQTQDGNQITVQIKGMDLDADTARAIKGFDVQSVYDMQTEDGSLLWSITLQNTSEKYIEFGDVGLPIPWNNKYASTSDTYNNRLTVHTFAGADSGYAYGVRCSGEGNYVIFTPVPTSGAKIEYVDNWLASNNGVTDNRTGSLYSNWCADTGGWYPGLSVYYIHSKAIHKTGRSYFTDASSLILAPGESKTYQFKFSAVRAGDNDPQESAASANNASESIEERETNFRSILYRSGMIDAIAIPSFQTAINMDTLIDLHYDDSIISDLKLDIQCVHENDPFDTAHIPNATSSKVNNSRTGLGLHEATGYEEAITHVKDTVDARGEKHHIYKLNFSCIGNNSLRVDYKLDCNGEKQDKFTEFEFNVLAELDKLMDTHANFMATTTQDNDPASATYGIYSDWYFASGRDSNQKSHWGDDWSHDNVNFMAMKNYLNPDPEQIASLERYLIDFMWNNYMKNTHSNFTVANYLSASGIYGTSSSPYTRTFSEVMEATAFFNMYRIEKAYPDLMEYRESPTYYLEKAYGIYYNRAGSGTTGYYGEQQIPDMIEALYAEGMTTQANNLKNKFAKTKGTNIVKASYPYGSEFEYDNTGEEGAYSAAKALKTYYPEDSNASRSMAAMSKTNKKTRAMRGMQPTWYQYADPVFRGGESWWNFQYTASLAGFIMDDYLRYEADGVDDSSAWAERLSYGAKLSNFNAVNMGQISQNYVGSVSWRYNMYKGGYGAMNVNDGGTRVMNNGWQDFSGESDEGLYGSLLSISSDVANDAVFGLVGYGCSVTKDGDTYSIVPKDGVGKRINLIDEKIFLESVQDAITAAEISEDGSMKLTLDGYVDEAHTASIVLDGAGIGDGYYEYALNGERVGQCYVSGNKGTIALTVEGEAPVVEITALENGENEAPSATISTDLSELQAIVPFELKATAYDDGAPVGSSISYQWEVATDVEGGKLTLSAPNAYVTNAVANKAGTYTVTLTVSDGEKENKVVKELVIGEAPERTAPVIHALTGKPTASNPSVAELAVDASADAFYAGTLAYEWSIKSAPEGANASIASTNSAQAKLLVDQPGEYTVQIKLTDADKVTVEDLKVVFGNEADGYQRTKNVITLVGTAPVLPKSAEVITAAGTVATAEVIWDAVDEAKYASVGSFLATGTADSAKVAAKVYVVNGVSTNIAPLATATAIINSVNDLGGVAGLNDGYTPSSSSDTSHGAWHNWLGEQAGTAWVQYTWSEPYVIDKTEAYYFRDGNGNFLPKDAKYEYRNEAGEWVELPNASGMGVERNTFNVTTFDPIYTTAIRMTMNPATLGCGVLEWRVYGYTLDKAALNSAISAAEALKSDAVLAEAIADAKATLNTAADQAAINAAAELLNSYVTLRKALDAAQTTDDGIYGECGQYVLTDAIAAARAGYEKDAATAADLSAAAATLNTAVSGANNVLNALKALKATITSASALSADENLTAAIANAQRTLDTQSGDAAALQAANNLLNAAINLKKAIDTAEATNLDNYVAEAGAQRDALVADAKAAFAAGLSDQSALEKAAAALNAGIKGLRRCVGLEASATAAVSVAGSSTPVASNRAALNDDAYGTSSYYNDLEGLALYHSQGTNTSSNTITYTWEDPVTIRGCDVFFWYNGTRGNTSSSQIRFPNSYSFEYLDPLTGTYKSVNNASGYGRVADDFNLTQFDEVTTKSLRMTITKSSRYGIGVQEWKVYGEVYDPETAVNAAPVANASATVSKFSIALNGSYTDDGKPFGAPITCQWALDSAPEGAEIILKNADSANATFYASKPGDYSFTLTVSDTDKQGTASVTATIVADAGGILGSDVAPSATSVESDYTSSWENLEGINNVAFEPTSSNVGTGQGWGNWSQSVGSEHYVGYIWKEAVTIGAADIYWYDDGGGTQVPSAYRMQYKDDAGQWKDVTINTPVASAVAKNKYNRVDFNTVTTKQLRLYMTVKSGAAANGIYRFKLYPILNVASIENISLETDAGVVPTLPATVACENVDGTKGKVSVIWNDLTADMLHTSSVSVKGINPDTGLISTAAIRVIGAYEPADDVIALIDAIGEVTLESADAIAAARAAYEALDDEQKAKVTNYQLLVDAEAALEELNQPEKVTYEAISKLSDLNADDTYVIVAWRYFGGSDSDTFHGYVLTDAANGSLRAPTEDQYATVSPAENFADTALWKITPVEGGYSIQNVGTSKYIGTALPAASDTPVALSAAEGECNGCHNFAFASQNKSIRYSGTSGTFTFGASAPAREVTRGNACNLTIYRVVGGSEPVVDYTHKLIALSDFQWGSHTDYQDNPRTILTKMADDGVSGVELGLLCGDFVDGSVYEDGSDTSMSTMTERFAQIKGYITDQWSDAQFLAIQGNHDASAWVKNGTLDATGPYEYEDYIVYMINEDDFPWWQAGYSSYSDTVVCKAAVEKTAADLDAYLTDLVEEGNEKPIIIATHVPMHWTSRTTTAAGWWSDNIYAKTLFDVVNEAALYQDIIFLFGHNHSEGYADAYPEGGSVNLFVPGDTIRIPDGRVASGGNYTEEIINFVYTNAGYCAYTHANFNPSVSTISLLTITPTEVEIEKYSPDGLYPSASYTLVRGQKGKVEPRVTIASVENPVTRREEATETFRATLKHGTDAVYTWTTDNADVVSFASGADSAEAVVTYVGGGDAIITCTVQCTDEEGEQKTVVAQYAVSVKAKVQPTDDTSYVQVTDLSKLSATGKYLIVLWRYFGGSESDSYNGYVFHSENNGSLRAPTEDEYATVTGEFNENAYWNILPVAGGWKLKNVGTGKYLSTIPANADEAGARVFTIAAGTCNGAENFAIGDASSAIRYSNSSGTFGYSSTGVEEEAGRAWAANATIYEVVGSAEIDFSALDAAVNAAAVLVEEAYTPASWAVFAAALAEALRVSDLAAPEQAQVDAAASALTDAMNALVTAAGGAEALIAAIGEITKDAKAQIDAARAAYDALSDEQKGEVSNAADLEAAENAYAELLDAYITLYAAIANAQKLPEADYSADSWAKLAAALEAAEKASDRTDLNLAAVHAAADAVTEAAKALVGKGIEVKAQIAAIGEVTLESKAAIEAARAAYNALSTAQKALVDNYVVLRRAEIAYENLFEVPYVNKSALKAAIQAVDALAADDFTAPSWSALNAECASGAVVLALEDATQAQVDEATAAIDAAMKALVGNEVAVIAQIAAIGDVTAESEAAIAAARAAFEALSPARQARVYNYPDLCQAEEDFANLSAESDVDYSALYAAIEAAEALNAKGYTAESWQAVADALAAARKALSSESQTNVDAAAAALDSAIAALKADCPSSQYVDVPAEGDWAHAGIDYCVLNGLMQGYSETKFVPNDVVTRAQLVTILYRAAGEPEVTVSGTFADVPAETWYTEAIEWAAANDIVNGKSEGVFDPMGKVTREQIAAILYRYAGSPDVEGELAFPDTDEVSNYATDAMLWAVNEGIINGVADPKHPIMLEPKAAATRAQIATIIMRYLEK